MGTVARELAHYITQTKFSDLPEEVVGQTKMCILDWIGAALPGIRQKPARMLLEVVKTSGGNPESTIIGDGRKTSCLNAALVNGTISYAVKLDQSSPRGSTIHPQPPMLPAALAVAEWKKLSGKEFLVAVLLGFDLETRVAMAVNPSHMGERGFHTTGTCGTFGALAAAAKLLRLKENQVVNALGIAGTQAAGLTAAIETFSRCLHAGKAAYNGLLAAMLAQKGFSGPEAIFEGEGGFCRALANTYDLKKITDGLGSQYLIRDQRFVRYVTCGAMHAAIDAVIELTKENEIAPGQIEEIDARTFPITLELCGRVREPRTFFDAQFSLPFALAVAATDGQVSIGQLTPRKFNDPGIMDLAKRVKGSVDPEFAAGGYTGTGDLFQSAKVTIRTKGGKEYHRQVNLHKGSPQNPFTEEELIKKFRSLASTVLPKPKVEGIVNSVEKLEEVDSMAKLVKFMYA
jgi:2-methylcitrate dehydratase PrpD